MANIGYARVSSTGQDLTVQVDKLTAYGCDDNDGRIFQEKRSGTTDKRPELQSCLKWLRPGDVLVVTKLDRLARSTLHLTQIADDLRVRKIGLKVLDQDIDTTTPTGKLLFNMLASIAEFETALRSERQTEGIAKALAKGVKFGAKAKLTPEQVEELKKKRSQGVLIKDLMNEYGLGKTTVYRLLSA
ncbi:MAG: recombinase family protein [Methylophaga sp.]|nr:recombinase family protein [Methylophaga sp.]